MFLAVAGLATFGASCSSDDGGKGNGGGDDKKTLTLSADKTSVKVDETVTFTVSEKDAEIYVEGKKISSKSTKFDKEGSYKVVAKKNGFNDSPVVTIKVTKDGTGGPGDNEKETLKLTILPTEVTLGNAVSFVVYEGTTDVSSSAKIFVNGSEITGSSYTATAVGTYSVVAKKEGANDSVEKTFTVVEAPEVGDNFLRVGTEMYEIDATQSKMMALTIQEEGQNYIRLYSQTIEEEEIFYCVFVMDVRSEDFAATQTSTTGAVARVFKIVVQDPDAEGVRLPGDDEDYEISSDSWILAENGEVDFAGAEVTLFDVNLIGFQDGGTTEIVASNGDGEIAYNGAFDSMYSIDTTGDQAKGINKNSKLNNVKKINTDLRSLKKLKMN